jgi:hypothetical protein
MLPRAFLYYSFAMCPFPFNDKTHMSVHTKIYFNIKRNMYVPLSFNVETIQICDNAALKYYGFKIVNV